MTSNSPHSTDRNLASQEKLPHAKSYYAASAHDQRLRPQLKGTQHADICIVGAGFTGLSTGLHLAEQGQKVTLLERARVGWGASGRNGGQIVNGYSRSLETIAARYGSDAARALGDMSLEGGEIIRRFVETYQIDCDLKSHNIIAALTPQQLRDIEALVANWRTHGHDGLEILDAEGIRAHIGTDRYVGGMRDHHGGHLHPLNLCLGEAAAIEHLGGLIYEDSEVLEIKPDSGEVILAEGKIKAEAIVICGNAYLGQTMPEISGKIMPCNTQIIATEPLGEARCRDLLPTDACAEDANYILDYYRCSADQRLLYGGGTIYGASSDNAGDSNRKRIEAALLPNLLKTFPQLQDVKIDYAWSGEFALTLTRIPHFGRIGTRAYFAHGYSGHGVTTSHLAGRLIAEAILQADSLEPDRRFNAFAQLPYYPFPGGRLLRIPYSVIGSWWYLMRDRLGI